MHTRSFILLFALLLSACGEDSIFATENDGDIGQASEACRAAVAEQLSREGDSLRMTSTENKTAFEQRYRFCMNEKGYPVPNVTP